MSIWFRFKIEICTCISSVLGIGWFSLWFATAREMKIESSFKTERDSVVPIYHQHILMVDHEPLKIEMISFIPSKRLWVHSFHFYFFTSMNQHFNVASVWLSQSQKQNQHENITTNGKVKKKTNKAKKSAISLIVSKASDLCFSLEFLVSVFFSENAIRGKKLSAPHINKWREFHELQYNALACCCSCCCILFFINFRSFLLSWC